MAEQTQIRIDYGRDIEREIAHLQESIAQHTSLVSRYPSRWLALSLLMGDEEIHSRVKELVGEKNEILQQVQESVERLRGIYGEELEIVIADRRYGFINGLVREVVERAPGERRTLSDKLDRIVTHRVLGIPIFLVAMWLVFKMTTEIPGPYMDWLDSLISGPVARWLVTLLRFMGLGGSWVESLLVDGVLAGVGGVLVFTPVLFSLYFFLALLEDSGYMARAAFVMDRLMRALGLHGKSFLPMLLGFGCTVPAIYATRTLENQKDRVLTGLLAPMMSCGARLPVYTVFAVAFMGRYAGRFIFALYLLGIIWAILTGLLLRRTLFKAERAAPFILELPPYRLPTLRGILIHIWERSSLFFKKASTIIVAVSIVLWLLLNLPWGVGDPQDSLFGKASSAVAPLLAPAGFGRWEATGALMTGFLAKEVVVGTLSQVYLGEESEPPEASSSILQDLQEIGVGFWEATIETCRELINLIPGVHLGGEGDEQEGEDTALVQALRRDFTPLEAAAFCVFVLLYVPCAVTVAAQRQEYGTRWALFSVLYQVLLAWIMSVLVYQGGKLLHLG
ncbi:MAG: ferrous iron transport protein B [Anaerolineae bacterium]|nr:ferrous iron transport protein B [Anaerolineae bacterium]